MGIWYLSFSLKWHAAGPNGKYIDNIASGHGGLIVGTVQEKTMKSRVLRLLHLRSVHHMTRIVVIRQGDQVHGTLS